MPLLTYKLMLITDNVDVGGDDTDSNSDSDGFANQDEEAISVKEPNWTLQEDMKVKHEHVDTVISMLCMIKPSKKSILSEREDGFTFKILLGSPSLQICQIIFPWNHSTKNAHMTNVRPFLLSMKITHVV